MEINQLFKDLILKKKGQEHEHEHEEAKVDHIEPIEQELVTSREEMTLEEINDLTSVGLSKIRAGKVALLILAGG